MQRIKIAISPLLKEKYGPEVCWTWRLLLSGIGLAWKEVPPGNSACDIAYVAQGERAGRSRLCIHANVQSWETKAQRRLGSVAHGDGWSHPIYEGEPRSAQPFRPVAGGLVGERDLVLDVFWLATGQEERYWPRNKHGHLEFGKTAFYREGAQRLALASSIGCGLQRALAGLGFTDAVPRWPGGKRAAACLSHDVEYPEVVRWLEPLRILLRRGLRGAPAAAAVLHGKRTHWHFSSWVEMEQSLSMRSAFYFVSRQGSLVEYATGTPDTFYDVRSAGFRKVLRYLSEKGCEIGLHASYRACESREKFAAEKELLEEVSGRQVHGNRHHYWRLYPDDPESTLLIHEQIGFKYDTSLTHERYVGWRRGLSWPYFPFHQAERRELKTLQIATAWMDDQLFGHRPDNPGDRAEILRALADRTAEQEGCLLIDVHDYVFDDVLFPEWAKACRSLAEYLIARSDFWLGTPREIAEHCIDRLNSITQASWGLTGAIDCQ